jgi:hypothetical protein
MKNFSAYYTELAEWIKGSNQNGNIEFAFKNGFDKHAVKIWLSSGASSLDLPIENIDDTNEVKQLLNLATIYSCDECNHYMFFLPGEIVGKTTECDSCLGIAKLIKKGP